MNGRKGPQQKESHEAHDLIILAVAVGARGPGLAQAHVTVQPESVPAGGFTRLDVRVPNERDDAATDKVEVEMPDGFLFVSYEPVQGWRRTSRPRSSTSGRGIRRGDHRAGLGRHLDRRRPDAAIQPGQFRDFGLSVGMPEENVAGDTLTFPAIQTYDNGEVVRWIGEPDVRGTRRGRDPDRGREEARPRRRTSGARRGEEPTTKRMRTRAPPRGSASRPSSSASAYCSAGHGLTRRNRTCACARPLGSQPLSGLLPIQ